MFIPYIKKAFNNLRVYCYNHQRFNLIDQILNQVYKVLFLRKLINYINAKEEYNEKLFTEQEEKKKILDEQKKKESNDNNKKQANKKNNNKPIIENKKIMKII